MSIWGGSKKGGGTGTTIVQQQNVSAKQIIDAVMSDRKSWVALAAVDFTSAEPASSALGDIYLSTKTGAGSVTATKSFAKDSLYYFDETRQWRGFAPKEGWVLAIKDTIYSFSSGVWVPQLKKDHFHKIIGQTQDKTYFLLANKTIYANKNDIVNFSLWPGDDGFDDDWAEFVPAGGGAAQNTGRYCLPVFTVWPTEAQLRGTDEPISSFLFDGFDANKAIGFYVNSNSGRPETMLIIDPTLIFAG